MCHSDPAMAGEGSLNLFEDSLHSQEILPSTQDDCIIIPQSGPLSWDKDRTLQE